MALSKSALLELSEAVSSADAGKMIHMMAQSMLQALIDVQADVAIGAERYERRR